MCGKFKPGDKAEFNELGNEWIPVSIESFALQWVSPHCGRGHLYLVEHADSPHTHLAHEDSLRPVEQWEPCRGQHRVIGGSWEGYHNVERLVGSER